jgi:hypothetical protein
MLQSWVNIYSVTEKFRDYYTPLKIKRSGRQDLTLGPSPARRGKQSAIYQMSKNISAVVELAVAVPLSLEGLGVR